MRYSKIVLTKTEYEVPIQVEAYIRKNREPHLLWSERVDEVRLNLVDLEFEDTLTLDTRHTDHEIEFKEANLGEGKVSLEITTDNGPNTPVIGIEQV